jgi:DNA-binding transcriptional ArsR family regulator
MSLRNPAVVDVMAPPAAFELEVVAGTPIELLVGMFAKCAGGSAIGDRTGEVWLHLLGLALELDAPDAVAFVDGVAAVAPLELRRHLLGLYVPSWCRLVGEETIELAARGDRAASARLLDDRRYYGGRARQALATLLTLSPRETKARVLAVLREQLDRFAPTEDVVRGRLAADAERKRRLLRTTDPYDLIDLAAGGYRYEAEPAFPRVLLIPHLEAEPSILLCQHRDARLICYPAAVDETSDRDRVLALGRALGDDKRLAILERLRAGEATLAELAEAVGLAKSTTHHHLGRLRAARLVTLGGNAERYTYVVSEAGVAGATRLLTTYTNPLLGE